MKSKKRNVWLIPILLLYSAWTATSVSAHAVLLRSNPPANAVLTQPPIQAELFFSETLEPQLSSITVFDSNSQVVDVGDARVDASDPTRMTVSLHFLSNGVYTVSWKVVSTVDGHQTVGTFPFAVGGVDAVAVQAIQTNTSARVPFSALLAKFLLLTALAVLVGQRLFVALVWEPALRSDVVAKPIVWGRLYHAGLIGLLFAIGLGMLSQAGQVTGSELSAPWNPLTGYIWFETRLGVIWLVRLLLAMLVVWMSGSQASALKKWTGFILNLALLFTVTLTSHAATESRPLFPMLGDWLHLLGMTFWLGGLIYLFTSIRQFQNLDEQLRTKLTSLVASRFSIHAMLFVALLGLTGFYAAYLRVGSWSALLTSLYGHVMLVKQALVAGLLIIAAINLLVISPRMKQRLLGGTTDTGLVLRFGKLLILELVLAGLLLANVSFLTYIPPGKPTVPNSDLSARQKADDLKFVLAISPGRVGQNTFTLKLTSADGVPLRSVKIVLLRFTSAQVKLAPSELQLISQSDGTFLAKGANLSLPGKWQVQAVVRRVDRFDAFVNFNFDLRKSGNTEQTAIIFRSSALLLILLGVACGGLSASVKERPGLRLGLGAPLAVLLIALGIFSLLQPIPTENVEPGNPIAPNSQSVATGQTLFTQYCVPCHGLTGKGDGPVGLTLNPRPADLSQHAIPGVHTDAQLFEWLTNGFPGSQMPPFKTTLSDTDRWNLVNFIRTLAPK